jgi:hypothetical protein
LANFFNTSALVWQATQAELSALATGAGVTVAGAGVAVAGALVAVGGTGVAVGGTAVAVGGTGVAVGTTGALVAVAGGSVGAAVGVAQPVRTTHNATITANNVEGAILIRVISDNILLSRK